MERSVRVAGCLIGALLSICACESSPDPSPKPAPTRATASASADELAVHLSSRIGWDRALTKLDVRGDEVLIGLGLPARAETDERPTHELLRWNARSDSLSKLYPRVQSAAASSAATFLVDANAELVRLDASGSQRVLLSRASGKPAPLEDGSVVVARDLGPGESDLWLVPASGQPRALAPAPGPDDLPIALGNRMIAFVSGRTTLASLFWVSTDGGEPVQLTNRGLVAGKPRTGFVPPPQTVLSASPSELVYDSGAGERWRVEIPSGTAHRIERGTR